MRALIDRLDVAISRACAQLFGPRPTDAAPGLTAPLSAGMCAACRQRWVAGRPLRDVDCAARLRHAVDEHFERLHEGVEQEGLRREGVLRGAAR